MLALYFHLKLIYVSALVHLGVSKDIDGFFNIAGVYRWFMCSFLL